MSEVVKALLLANQQLVEQIVALTAHIVELTRPTVLPVSEGRFASEPLYVNEDEEDMEHAMRAGLIDKTEMEEALRLSGFAHTEIDVG